MTVTMRTMIATSAFFTLLISLTAVLRTRSVAEVLLPLAMYTVFAVVLEMAVFAAIVVAQLLIVGDAPLKILRRQVTPDSAYAQLEDIASDSLMELETNVLEQLLQRLQDKVTGFSLRNITGALAVLWLVLQIVGWFGFVVRFPSSSQAALGAEIEMGIMIAVCIAVVAYGLRLTVALYQRDVDVVRMAINKSRLYGGDFKAQRRAECIINFAVAMEDGVLVSENRPEGHVNHNAAAVHAKGPRDFNN